MNPQQITAEVSKMEMLQSRLSLMEQDKIQLFCSDPLMVAAIEKALLYGIYMMGTIKPEDKQLHDTNWAFIPHNSTVSNENLGAEFRAKIAGLSFLDDAFKQVKKLGEQHAKGTEEVNPAL